MKRFFALFLVLILCVCLLPLSVFADGTMRGVSMGKGVSIEQLSDDYFWGQKSVKRKNVTSITFQSNLDGAPAWPLDISENRDKSVLAWLKDTDLIIAADGKVQLPANCAYLFAGFTGADKLSFGDNVDTSGVTNMTGMFYGMYSVKKLDLSAFNTEKVTRMTGMFYGMTCVKKLDLSAFNTEKVTDMSYMFTSCHNLTELNLSSFRTPVLEDMRSMFDSCYNLEEINLSSFDTANVTSMNSTFGTCLSLTRVDVSSFNTEHVTDMSSMFYNCRVLKELDLSNFKTPRVQYFSSMFRWCPELESLDISGFTAEKMIYSLFIFKDTDITNLKCDAAVLKTLTK